MKTKAAFVLCVIGLGVMVSACSAAFGEDPTKNNGVAGPDDGALDPAGKPARDAQLNLSHVECTDSGVNAHFVLLHHPSEPGPITVVNNGVTLEPVEHGKKSGNVWHYNVLLGTDQVDITSATVDGISLHNPSEYSGDYECQPENPSCPVIEPASNPFCTAAPLTNPEAECAFFGLEPFGKAAGNGELSQTSTQTARLALVKSGSAQNTGDCAPGESSYRYYLDVKPGDTLETPFAQGISHVTYCVCANE